MTPHSTRMPVSSLCTPQGPREAWGPGEGGEDFQARISDSAVTPASLSRPCSEPSVKASFVILRALFFLFKILLFDYSLHRNVERFTKSHAVPLQGPC